MNEARESDRGDRLHPSFGCATGATLRRLARAVEEALQDLPPGSGARALDLGCGNMPYRPLVEARGWIYVGADLAGNPLASVTLESDGSLPRGGGGFDAGFSFQVLEHVHDVPQYLHVLHQALKPDAPLLLSTHGIWPFHPDPEDYWRWTRDGLHRELEAAGFRIVRTRAILGPLSASVQFLAAHLRWSLHRPFGAMAGAALQPLIALLDLADGPPDQRRDAAVFLVTAQRRE